MPSALDIVDKIDDGSVIRPLNGKEIFCIHPERRGTKTAQTLIQRLKDNGEYLYCHCVNPPAVMFPRHYFSHNFSRYSLVCHVTKGLHDRGCEHYREIKGWLVNDPKAVNRAITRQSDTFPSLSLFPAFAQAQAQTNTKPKKGSTCNRNAKSGKRPDKLVNLVRFLIKKSGQNVLTSNQVFASQFKALNRLKDAGANTQFANGTLNDWIFIGGNAFYQARTALTKIRDQGLWPVSAGRPHAFLAMVTNDAIEINEEDKANKTVTVNGKVFYVKRILTEGQGIRTKPPYLVFISLCEFIQGGAFRLHTAYIKSIVYPNLLMPIDSNYERKFARQVIHHIKDGDSWSLTKPLEGKAIDDCFVMPDFLLENTKLEINHLVEIMGMLNDQDYVDRKEYILPLMGKGWPDHLLHELDPVKPSFDVFKYIQKLEILCE